MLLTQAGVVSALLGRGLLDADAIVDGDLVVADSSRRNINFEVLRERGRSYFVKQGVGDDRRRTVMHEAAMYDVLAASPALELLAPRRLLWDAEDCTLVVELAREAESLAALHRRRRRVPVNVARALGRALGTLHQTTSPYAERGRFRNYTPTLFEVHRPALSAFTWMSSGTLEIVKMVQRSDGLVQSLEQVRRDWRIEALIHGDVRWDNCLWLGGAGARLTLVDWEMAGAGDPCWDVGTALSEYVGAWVAASPLVPEMAPEAIARLSSLPLTDVQRATRALWRAYADTMELGAAADEWCLRAVRYAGARLVEMACETARSSARATEDAVYLLQTGANILERPLDAAVELFGLTVLPVDGP